jgi:hypothetical protein
LGEEKLGEENLGEFSITGERVGDVTGDGGSTTGEFTGAMP